MKEFAFIIEWNRTFPLDRWWREKHSIPLFSQKHLEMCQLDIVYEYIEDVLVQRGDKQREKQKEAEQNYKKGEWLKVEQLTDTDSSLWDNMDISKFNKKINE